LVAAAGAGCSADLATRAARSSPAAPLVAKQVSAPGVGPVVRIDTGEVRGRASGTSAAFRGIPYAAPPVGELRFRPPAPAESWSGVREATGYGYVCMQSPSSFEPKGTPMGSEDCLTLNVFSPDLHPSAPLPVLVFVHGGFFSWGSASKRVDGEDIFDGAALARQLNAIVVTLNYRLGPLGFVAHPALAREDPRGSDGNYGLLDQLAALRWVRRNIAAFGGDAARVTLSGHSAGAISTIVLAASPLGAGLFSRAIAFSGGGFARPEKRAQALGAALARALECDAVADVAGCMRSRTASDVVAAMPEVFVDGDGFGPNVDGTLLPATPIELYRARRTRPVPILIGTTADEFSTMAHTILKKAPTNDAELKAALPPALRPIGDAIAARYPASGYASPTDALIHVWSDAAIVCPVRTLTRAIAAAEPGQVHRFVFAHTYAAAELRPLGAGHGLELPLLFRDLPGKFRFTTEESALADAFTASIAAFVRTGDPNVASLSWPAYDAASDSYLELETPPSIKHGLRAELCDFWDAQGRGR
jgi:para-nitrobenzyl esterase